MIREFFQRGTIRRAFSRYIPRETIDEILSDRPKDPGLRSGDIEYVLIWMRGESPEQLADRMGRASELAVQYGGTVDCMVSGLVVVCFGTMPVPDPQQGDRSGLATAMSREFGKDIKLVHGSSRGHYGNFGSPGSLAYSFILPEFEAALSLLCALKFGETMEYVSAKDGVK